MPDFKKTDVTILLDAFHRDMVKHMIKHKREVQMPWGVYSIKECTLIFRARHRYQVLMSHSRYYLNDMLYNVPLGGYTQFGGDNASVYEAMIPMIQMLIFKSAHDHIVADSDCDNMSTVIPVDIGLSPSIGRYSVVYDSIALEDTLMVAFEFGKELKQMVKED